MLPVYEAFVDGPALRPVSRVDGSGEYGGVGYGTPTSTIAELVSAEMQAMVDDAVPRQDRIGRVDVQ